MAGSQAENIRQETDDGLLTNGQVGAAVATGVAGSAFGYLGGRIAQKLGFDDVDHYVLYGRYSAIDGFPRQVKHFELVDCYWRRHVHWGVCVCSYHVFDWRVLLLARGESDVLRRAYQQH